MKGWLMLVSAVVLTACGAYAQTAPRITGTLPQVGAKDVDPATNAIMVQFDQDMGTGMSWTGGGPEFPEIPAGAKGYWRDKRTCVLPVKLQPGHAYRVGINSTSFMNFRSAAGAPATPGAIYFTTRGATAQTQAQINKPKIVSISPAHGSRDVDAAATKALQVTFDMPMGAGCSWTGGGPNFPKIPEGQKTSWSADKKTCTLPVQLEPNHDYQLGLNSLSFKNFSNESGVPLDPVVYRFHTK